jgi:hypothetical protein
MKSTPSYRRATQETVENLQQVAKSLDLRRLTKLSLPEIDAVVDLVAKVVPAGNVPGMILSGLTRISGNKVQPQKARQDINILFREVSNFFEQAKYGAVFAGPAAIIWGYQNLLRLAGKDPESAFPEGIWQFYVDYALREDTARHANETHGFDTALEQNDIRLSSVDRLTAWVMASVTCLHQYHSLLASEWYERTALWSFQEIAGMNDLYREWEKQKPYVRDASAANYDYPAYRRIKFRQFLESATASLNRSRRTDWETKLRSALEGSLPSYQRQMSILAYLEPGAFGETRTPISLGQAHIGIIHKGNYFLLPICEPGTSNPLDVRTARSQIATMLSLTPSKKSMGLESLARVKRNEVLALRKKLNPTLQADLNKLRFTPILINKDQSDPALLLSEIRQRERGIGDHALTIFDTGKTFVFDQSHIFFDGGWGAALAEIMTNEALSWAGYLNMLSPVVPGQDRIYTKLELDMQPNDIVLIEQAPHVSSESGAESNQINIKACLDLRHYFEQRSDLIRLTINDLLVLYRAIHAATYQMSAKLRLELDALEKTDPEPAKLIKQDLEDVANINPSILIPVDASKRTPRDRIYPLNMEVPLVELDLLGLHTHTLHALTEKDAGDRFESLQMRYLATLGGFGTILAKAKDIAVRGESASVGAIKLLAHLPSPIKRLLDKVPERYEKLNNLLKGTEVISNLGAVAKSSSLTRFITAKDDNEQKQLTWGVMTDAKGVMYITLRDFRPHVAILHEIDRKDIAKLIAQDYLDAYVHGLNQFVQEITLIVIARPRKT